jgi:hypothetical protein
MCSRFLLRNTRACSSEQRACEADSSAKNAEAPGKEPKARCAGQTVAFACDQRAVNQTPANRNLAYSSTNERQRDDKRARDDTGLQDPNIAHRIEECPDEENSDDDVCKCQPVGAVSQPRILGDAIRSLATLLPDGRQFTLRAHL